MKMRMLLHCPYCGTPLTSSAQRVAHLADAAACPQRFPSAAATTSMRPYDDADETATD